MSDPLEFLEAAHRQAEETAQAASPGPWHVNDESGVQMIYDADGGTVIAGGQWGGEVSAFEPTADARHITLHHPAAVLRRVARERALLSEHQPEREVYIYPDVDQPEPGVLTRACKTCAQGQHYDLRPEVYPCPTVRLLAEAWGWTGREE